MSGEPEDTDDLGRWAKDFLVDIDGYEVEPDECRVLYETVVVHHEDYDDRSARWSSTDHVTVSADSLKGLYEAVETERGRHKAERFRTHRFEYGPIRKVVLIAEDSLDEDRLAGTDARRRHIEEAARKAAEERARKDAEVARREAADRELYELLHQRFGQQTQGD